VKEITLESVGVCIGLEWDSDGEVMGIRCSLTRNVPHSNS
jgi:hypothetical protein